MSVSRPRISIGLWFCLVMIVLPGHGQYYNVTRYADDNGLPSRIVRDVIQDDLGFMWIAGNNGLYRFDGQEFYPYLAALKDTVGLRDNKITTILQTSDTKIWVGTPKGLHILEQGTIQHFKLLDQPTDEEAYILNLFEDRHQNLWVGTYGGLFLVDQSGNAIHFLDENNSAISTEVIWGVTEDSKGTIWVATNEGPYIMGNTEPWSATKMPVATSKPLLNNSTKYYKFQQYNDSLFLIDSNKGLLKGNLRRDTLSIDPFLNEKGKRVEDYSVQGSIIDSKGSIWVATWKYSFKKYKIVREQLVKEEVLSKNGFSNLSGTIHAIYEDKQENIWMANTNGLYKVTIDNSEITTFPNRNADDCLNDLYGIYALIEDKANNLWITTPKKLYRIKKEDVLTNNCPSDYRVFEIEGMQLARNLTIDSRNRLWIGADDGLFVTQLDADQNPGSFIKYTKEDGLPHNWSYDVFEISENCFWIGNYGGLVKIELQNGRLKNPKISVYTSDKGETNRLVNSQALEIESDASGNIWVGTFSGLSKLLDSNGKGKFENYNSIYGDQHALSNDAVKKIFKDKQGNIWIATQRGLNLYDPLKNEFIQFGHAEGLPSEYILGIQQDTKDFLWIGTTNGILKAKYNAETNQLIAIKHFTSNDGLADNIPYRNALWIDDVDNVFMGSREGISVFRSGGRSAVTDKADFDIRITDISSTQKKDMGFTSIFHKMKENKVVLSHKENSIKINYSALDYSNPQNNKYRHKLLPVNQRWIETNGTSELSYYNLSPGSYEFILDGSNAAGVWSSVPIHIQLEIRPPFWRSKWALLLYIAALAGILRFFYLLRIKRKVKQLERETHLEKALLQEREELRRENAADFHDELGSQVTKISLFLTLAERSVLKKEDPQPWFQKIHENIKSLSGGFRDLLWVIDPKKDSLGDTFLRLKDFGEELFESNGIDFRTSGYQITYTERFLDPQTKKQLIMIFKEAMNNCIKYSGCSKANLVVNTEAESSSISLKDNGTGFNVQLKSKGRGLQNMKTRAKKINAILEIESNNDGTTIRLSRIPHLSDSYSLQDM